MSSGWVQADLDAVSAAIKALALRPVTMVRIAGTEMNYSRADLGQLMKLRTQMAVEIGISNGAISGKRFADVSGRDPNECENYPVQ